MSQIGDPTGNPFPPPPPIIPCTTTAPTVQKQISDALEPIVNAADGDTIEQISIFLRAMADGLELAFSTADRARFAVAASRKIEGLCDAHNVDGLKNVISALRQAHGAIVDPLIVWA